MIQQVSDGLLYLMSGTNHVVELVLLWFAGSSPTFIFLKWFKKFNYFFLPFSVKFITEKTNK